ncbi:MAG: hypothetical protein JWM32_1780 [Verrucomicrobia bacterium]|nr:hypothetical protein [Verrucomicrobiota bacterium]
MEIPYLILGAILVSLMLAQINQRAASPLLSIVDRWLRWLVFAFGAAQVFRDFKLVDRPYWALAVFFFLLWFLGETLLNWLSIHALSVSPLPLFPRYVLNLVGDEWPTQPKALQLREWLRGQNYKQVQAMKAEIGGGIYLRVSIYQNLDGTVRVQVTFIPQASGAVTICFAITSLTSDGSRYVTDNLYVPFAGFYPENWFVERAPLCRSLPKLLERHQARIASLKDTIVSFAVDPLTDLNATQHELDRLNTELGFLHSHSDREDLGKITHEGRYRVWKEIWTLNYLGRSARYL